MFDGVSGNLTCRSQPNLRVGHDAGLEADEPRSERKVQLEVTVVAQAHVLPARVNKKQCRTLSTSSMYRSNVSAGPPSKRNRKKQGSEAASGQAHGQRYRPTLGHASTNYNIG